MGFRVISHQTHGGIEISSRLTRSGEQTNGDRVGTLLQQRDGVGAVLVHEATRKSDSVVENIRVRLRSRRRSRNLASGNVVSPSLVSVQVYDATVLVADGENVARHHTQVINRERLLVELNLVGRGGERTHMGLLPARCVLVVPVRGHLSHLVVPLLHHINGIPTQVVRVIIVLVAIETSLQQKLPIIIGQNRVHVDVRA